MIAHRQLRPLGLGDIFDEGFDLYKKNFALLVLVTVVVTVPLDIAVSIIRMQYLHGSIDLASMLNSSDLAGLSGYLGQAGLSMLVSSLLYAAPVAALAEAASARYLGEKITLKQSYRVPLRRLPALLVTALVCGLAAALGFFLCTLGLAVFAVLYLFTAHVFVREKRSVFKALGRSANLVSGYGGRVFATLLLLVLVYAILAIGIEVPLAYAFTTLLQITPGSESLFGGVQHVTVLRRQMVDQLSGGLAHLLITPFLVSVITVLYYDLRVRKEAFDIELLAQDLGYAPFVPSPNLFPPPAVPPLVTPGPVRGQPR